MPDFRREYRDRLPLPLAQLYSRVHDAKYPRARHDNAFYVFEALVKLTAAPLIATYLHEVQHGGRRAEALDRLLAHLSLPSFGQWVGMLRGLAHHFGNRPDATSHPLGHLSMQLTRPRSDLPGLVALYQRIKNGPDGESAGDQTCSALHVFDALVQYRNGVFGHGANRFDAFYEEKMGPLLTPAVNEILADGVLDFLGPRGSRLVQLTELRTLEDGRIEVGLRELTGLKGIRLAPLLLTPEQSAGLLPNRVALLWPGRTVPLRLDPLLVYRERELAEEVLFLNRDHKGKQVEYLSYSGGPLERDRSTVPELAALLSLITNRCISEEQLRELAERTRAETASVEELFDAPPPRAQLGDYEILGEVGQGAMGVILLARQQSLGRLVALKMLRVDLAGDATALERFRREIRALARCDHPNIVKVLATGTLPDGRQYYAMEYVPGCNLEQVRREWTGGDAISTARLDGSTWTRAVLSASRKQRDETIQRSRDRTKREDGGKTEAPPSESVLPLPRLPELPEPSSDPGGFVRRVVRLMHDAASALQAVHEQGLIHRDVKPANLMLTPDGERIVLMDFGLVKGESPSGNLSEGAGFLGTLRYAAPEQLAAASVPVGANADVRALGAILWEFLARRRLFGDTDDPKQLAVRILNDDLPLLRQIDRGVNRDLEAVVARATERSAAARLGSAGQMAQYLQMYLDGQPLPIRSPGPGELLGRWMRRHRVALLGIGAPLLVLLTVVVAGWIVRVTQQYAEEMARLRQVAETKQKEAEKNKNEAEHQRELAQTAEAFSRRLTFLAHMSLGQRAWQANHVSVLRELLDRYDPGQLDAGLRGFEWHYLWRLSRGELFCSSKQPEEILGVAFSPEATHLVWRNGSSQKNPSSVTIRDLATGRETVTLKKVGYHVESFSPVGMLLAVTQNRALQIRDAATGKWLYTLDRQLPLSSHGFVFSPNGKRLAFWSEERTYGPVDLLIWDLDKRQKVRTIRVTGSSPYSMAFSPDGSQLAAKLHGGTILWDLATGEERLSLNEQGGGIVVFHPDGEQFAAASPMKVTLWQARSGRELLSFNAPAEITQLAFSPSGQRLALTLKDRSVRLYDTLTGKEVLMLKGHTDGVSHVAFSPDGTRLVSGSLDRTVRVWDVIVESGKETIPVRILNAPLSISYDNPAFNSRPVAISPGGALVAGAVYSDSGTDGSFINVWERANGRERPPLRGPSGDVRFQAFSPNGQRLAAGGARGTNTGWVRAWSLGSDKMLLLDRATHSAPVNSLAFSADSQLLATAAGDKPSSKKPGEVKVWDLTTEREVSTFKGHKGPVFQVVFSPDGSRLASSSSEAAETLPPFTKTTQIIIWEWRSGREVHTLPTLGSWITCLAFSPNGKWLAAGSDDRSITLWDVDSGKLLHTLTGHAGPINHLQFSPDSQRLASASWDQTIKLWDAVTGAEALTLTGHEGPVERVSFDPDGRWLASYSVRDPNGMLRLWDARPPRPFTDADYRSELARRWLAWQRRQADDAEQKEQWFPAAFHLSQLLAADPKDTRLLSRRARARVELKQWDGVLDDCNAAIMHKTQEGEVWHSQGLAHAARGRLEEALQDYVKALGPGVSPCLVPGQVWLERGTVLLQLFRWEEARDAFSEAVKREPKGWKGYYGRGTAQAELGQWDKAVSDFTWAAKLESRYEVLLSRVALAQLGANDQEGYRRTCAALLQRFGRLSSPETASSVAWTCSLAPGAVADPAWPVGLAEQALVSYPRQYLPLRTLGGALYRDGKLDQAITRLNEAVKFHGKGGSFEDWVFLAMARFRLGKADQAREALDRAIKLYDERMKPAKPGSKPPAWDERVQWQYLRKEAEALVKGGKP